MSPTPAELLEQAAATIYERGKIAGQQAEQYAHVREAERRWLGERERNEV